MEVSAVREAAWQVADAAVVSALRTALSIRCVTVEREVEVQP